MNTATVVVDHEAAVADQALAATAEENLWRQTHRHWTVRVRRRKMRYPTDVLLVLDGGILDA